MSNGRLSRWWGSAHTHSQSAANLTLEATRVGYSRETLAVGRHCAGASALDGVDALLTFTLKPASGGSGLTMTYASTSVGAGRYRRACQGCRRDARRAWASLRALLGA